jgi:hypothetical protein
VWLIARRLGPEPILFFLVCLFIQASAWNATGRHGLARVTHFLVCGLLPWVSPPGPVIGFCLVVAAALETCLEGRGHASAAAWSLIGLALGAATMVIVWNALYHGHWWLGGYAPYYKVQPAFGARNPLAGFLLHIRALLLEGWPLLLCAVLGLRASPGRRASLLTLPGCLALGLMLMFASFHQPEPTRRLAAVWPAFGAVVGRTWDRLELPLPLPQALVALAGVTGFYWLFHFEGRRFLGPDGLFYPNVLWVERYLSGAPAWQLLPAGGLLLVGLAAGIGTWRLLGARTA